MKTDFVYDFICKCSDNDLLFLQEKFHHKLVEDAADFLLQEKDIDHWFASADGADGWFEMIDEVADLVEKELKLRKL